MALKSGEESEEFRAAKQLYSKSLTGIIEAIFGSSSNNEPVDVSEEETTQGGGDEFRLPNCEDLLKFLGVEFGEGIVVEKDGSF